MNDLPTAAGSGPWRILILDPDPGGDDPKWLLATVSDVRPAGPGDQGPDEITSRWVHARSGSTNGLAPMRRALAWRVGR